MEARLNGLDEATLTPIVRRALGRQSAVPVLWQWEPLPYAAYLPRRTLLRVEGQAAVGERLVPWAAVVKILQPPRGREPSIARAAAGWDRERKAYRSGLLRRLQHAASGLAAPRLLHAEQQVGGAVWLWLERVEDAFHGHWSLAQYGIAARHLGRFNGAFARPEDLPRDSWLSREWAAMHAEPELLPAARRELDALLEHPGVRAVFPAHEAHLMKRLLDDQPLFMDALGRLPLTLCHHDASSANLLARRRTPAGATVGDECDSWITVAIDWEELGHGPVGAEIATLVFGSMRRGTFPSSEAALLERVVLEQYERGLRDAGWTGDAAVMRLCYQAAVALRWGLLPATLRLLAGAGSLPPGVPERERPAVLAQRVPLVRFLLRCAEGARALTRL